MRTRGVERTYRQRTASTLFLRVPAQDWIKVTRGHVTEFRAALGNVPKAFNVPGFVPLPTLCVAYRKQPGRAHDKSLMVLDDVRHEALGAITDEGLARAGYTGPKARDLFRREWMIANKRKWEPLRRMIVFTVQPYKTERVAECALALIGRLYGDFIETEEHGGIRARMDYARS